MELDLPQYEAVMLSDSDIASTVPSGYSPLGALQFDRDFTLDGTVCDDPPATVWPGR